MTRNIICSLWLCLLLAPALSAAQAPADAPLRPGDRLAIRVWIDTAIVDSARVDQQGRVVLPLLGTLSVTKLTAAGAADSIRRSFARVVKGEAIEVTPLRRVTVSGEIRRPGVYYLEPEVTFREAIAIAGGITDIGSTNAIVISRGNDRLRVRDWEQRADASMLIQSGDVIWARREPWLKRNALSAVSAAGVLLSVLVTLTR